MFKFCWKLCHYITVQQGEEKNALGLKWTRATRRGGALSAAQHAQRSEIEPGINNTKELGRFKEAFATRDRAPHTTTKSGQHD